MTSEQLPASDLAARIGAQDTAMWLPMNTVSVTAAYSFAGRDKIVLADATGGAFTVTLPDATLRKNQQPITVKRMNGGGNAVTIGSAAGTIDGAATTSLAAQYATKSFVSDGSVWVVVASF
jgi:hypothetical protein